MHFSVQLVLKLSLFYFEETVVSQAVVDGCTEMAVLENQLNHKIGAIYHILL